MQDQVITYIRTYASQKFWHRKCSPAFKVGTCLIFKDLSQFMDQKAGESDDGAGEVSPSQRQAIFAGIMTAVKEIELRERYSSQSCEVRY
jgi:hypothetical protein